MATIHIGSDFKELRLREKGDFHFEEQPYAVLFNKQNSQYFAADNYSLLDDGYDVDWTADVTQNMMPGSYVLEIYANDDKTELLYRKEAYASAIIVAASPDQRAGNSNS